MARIGQVNPLPGGDVLADAFLATPTGQQVLYRIEERARSGISKAATDNALNLMVFALAGGVVGGAIFKGPVGTMAAGALALWAGVRILDTINRNAASTPSAVQGYALHEDPRVITIR